MCTLFFRQKKKTVSRPLRFSTQGPQRRLKYLSEYKGEMSFFPELRVFPSANPAASARENHFSFFLFFSPKSAIGITHLVS